MKNSDEEDQERHGGGQSRESDMGRFGTETTYEQWREIGNGGDLWWRSVGTKRIK